MNATLPIPRIFDWGQGRSLVQAPLTIMAKHQNHMLEALRASVGERKQSIGERANPSLGRGSSDTALDQSKGAVPSPQGAPRAPGESVGGLVSSNLPLVKPAPERTGATQAAPKTQVEAQPKPNQRQVVLPLGLGTLLFAASFIVVLAFGSGWLLAGGKNPLQQTTQAGIGALGTSNGAKSGSFNSMRTDFAAFKDPRPNIEQGALNSARGSSSAMPAQTPILGPDAALRDPANHYTVQAVEYANQRATCKSYAQAAYNTLKKAGLPVVQPLLTDGKILLVVGAGKTAAELKSLIRDLKQVPDPNGSGRLLPDPYVVPIQRVLP